MNDDRNLNDLFDQFKDQWDTQEPELGHQQRFLNRLEGKKKNSNIPYRLFLPIAAAILILFGIFINDRMDVFGSEQEVAISPKVQETQMYFASVIKNELAKIEKEKDSPETKQLVQDALTHMEKLEKDYDKLNEELAKNGESKQLIHAMITNLQTRITFLQEVLDRIESIKKIKENYHENNAI